MSEGHNYGSIELPKGTTAMSGLEQETCCIHLAIHDYSYSVIFIKTL